MKVSYAWLQTFFENPLPQVADLADTLTLHAMEIEEVVATGADHVFDVKVLPDKSAWLMSHRGVAREVAAITGLRITFDPLTTPAPSIGETDTVAITRSAAGCDYYSAALIAGVVVAPSPLWLQERLRAIGQRPINNVVDVLNYVMFEMGQPLHAFDADRVGRVGDRYALGIRSATDSEPITTLTGETLTLTTADMVIVDGTNNCPLAVAGVKGGIAAEVTDSTSTILIEAAHFDRVMVRKTAKRHNLRTDASARYEHGVPRALAPLGLFRACQLLQDVTQGTVVGYVRDGEDREVRTPIEVEVGHVNRVLGIELSIADVARVFQKLDYEYTVQGERFTIVPPFERDDLVIPEDCIEEIGRLHGFQHVVAKPLPPKATSSEINARHYYAERIRSTLSELGFSEVYTSSFRTADMVKLKNALASDKGYLRSTLRDSVKEALVRNSPHRDVLGLLSIRMFELGTVFLPDNEEYHLVLAVRTGTEYKSKIDGLQLQEGMRAVADALGREMTWLYVEDGVAECSVSDILPQLAKPLMYEPSPPTSNGWFRPFSVYPAISRDLALWMKEGTDPARLQTELATNAGPLCVRVTHIDTFTKDARTSFTYRFVFQSFDRTLTAAEADTAMLAVAAFAASIGGEVR